MGMGRPYFIVNATMMKITCLVKIMIAAGREFQVKKIKALTVIRGNYQLHIAVVLYFFLVFYPFPPIFYYFFLAIRKSFVKVSAAQRSKSRQYLQNQPARGDLTCNISENHRNSVNVFFQCWMRHQKRQVSCEHRQFHYGGFINYYLK